MLNNRKQEQQIGVWNNKNEQNRFRGNVKAHRAEQNRTLRARGLRRPAPACGGLREKKNGVGFALPQAEAERPPRARGALAGRGAARDRVI